MAFYFYFFIRKPFLWRAFNCQRSKELRHKQFIQNKKPKKRRQNDHRVSVVRLQMKLFGSTSRSCWNNRCFYSIVQLSHSFLARVCVCERA